MVASVGLLTSNARVQLALTVFILFFFCVLTAALRPWRTPALNFFDVSTTASLGSIGVFGILFVSLQGEVKNLKTLAGSDALAQSRIDKLDVQLDTFSTVLGVLLGFFCALFGTVVCWCAHLAMPGVAQRHLVRDKAVQEALLKSFMELVKADGLDIRIDGWLDASAAYDLYHFRSFIAKVNPEAEAAIAAASKANEGVATQAFGKMKGAVGQKKGVAEIQKQEQERRE